MILRDYHLHTTFSDGKNTPKEMVQRAIEMGMKSIGFSDHSYTHFDESYCMHHENEDAYKSTVARLKEKYRDKIEILCGIEQDYHSLQFASGYDYVIGSVHYIYVNGEYIPVDESEDILKKAIDKHFGGDSILLAKAYFDTVARVVRRTDADIIGHFDLITKFNNSHLFDESNSEYISAWKAAVDRLIPYGKPFEINTGAISRGYRKVPYPAHDIIEYIKSKGGKLILSGDAHSVDGIGYGFDEFEAKL